MQAKSIANHATGGSTGWQAPEQLILRSGGEARQGRSVDIFTFGLLLFYCLSGGQHPFGEGIERDYRILNVCLFWTISFLWTGRQNLARQAKLFKMRQTSLLYAHRSSLAIKLDAWKLASYQMHEGCHRLLYLPFPFLSSEHALDP